jgi:hypothetical protein
LLYLKDQVAAANCVDATAGNENRFACRHVHGVHEWFQLVVLEPGFEVLRG